MSERADRRPGSGRPSPLAAVASAAALLVGLACAGAGSSRLRWDPDAEVLPLRQATAAERDVEPHLRAMVILLPDDEGGVGAIEVSNEGGSVTLGRAREAVAFDDLASTFVVSDELLREAGQPALAAEPPAVREFSVLFRTGGVRLSAESDGAWPAIVEALTARPVPEVTIAAHADRAGSEAHNLELSERRARVIRASLLEAGLDGDLIEIAWYGEARPAVPTADGVAEPRNRRAIIRVR